VSAQRAALLGGLLCTAPVVVWAAGVIALDDGMQGARLADGAAGLWLAQALCLGVLLPGCVTLWSSREFASGVLGFVLFPLPVLVLAWLMGVLPVSALLRGPVVLAGGAVVVAAAVMALCRWLPAPARAAAVLTLQAGLGTATLMWREAWLAWTGL
jgi:hypothetical protein